MNVARIAARTQPPRPQWGGTLVGLLLGIALGTLLALAVAWYVTRHSPFRSQSTTTVPPSEIPKEILGMIRSPNGGAPPPTNPAPSAAPSEATSAPLPPSPATAAPTQPPTPPASPSAASPLLPSAPSRSGPATAANVPPPLQAAPPAAQAHATAPPTPPQPAPPPPAAVERWYWQVGAFGSEQEANRVRAELALMGLTSRVEPAQMEDGRTLYRVRVGPYPSQQAAQAARSRLQGAGYQPVMVKG
ncbi:SPOR domain-containing protein [Hydrogenophilus thiooxidans]|uniref:SPOR domain-containing protein n=1 Tax=Hydrogenophilus thiooxidans TaxID=2820326 RepID=UPI001C21C596|nr:SPOR domain-containing protein [Hydrogenophilus thiooxidans]